LNSRPRAYESPALPLSYPAVGNAAGGIITERRLRFKGKTTCLYERASIASVVKVEKSKNPLLYKNTY
jgi:hypothetical protein